MPSPIEPKAHDSLWKDSESVMHRVTWKQSRSLKEARG